MKEFDDLDKALALLQKEAEQYLRHLAELHEQTAKLKERLETLPKVPVEE